MANNKPTVTKLTNCLLLVFWCLCHNFFSLLYFFYLKQKEDHEETATPLLGDEDASKFTTVAHYKVSLRYADFAIFTFSI